MDHVFVDISRPVQKSKSQVFLCKTNPGKNVEITAETGTQTQKQLQSKESMMYKNDDVISFYA